MYLNEASTQKTIKGNFLLWEQGPAGSNPSAPTNTLNNLRVLILWSEKSL